jgi:mannosyltransferase
MKHVDYMRGQPKPIPVHRQNAAIWRLVLAGLLLLAMGLRLYRLEAQSLWYDEGVTAQVASQGLADLTRWTADDIQPPLYYYVESLWTQLAGRSEWALRFPSAFFGVLLVPLMAILASRTLGRRAGVPVALMATLSPLYVYYSQEARMYTLLTCLGVLGAVLLRAILRQSSARRRRGLWAAFAAVGIAAMYTHYFAAMLLAALALYLALILTMARRPPATDHGVRITDHVLRITPQGSPLRSQTLALEGLIAGLAIGLAYLPWLPAMLSRFRVDASYWQGRLKLHEALRHVLLSFSLGETVLEATATPLLVVSLALLVLCVLALAVRTVEPWRAAEPPEPGAQPLAFLLLVLLVPLALILALSYRNPKFNPRYLMLASPAYYLLLTGGMATLWDYGRLALSKRSRELPIAGAAASSARAPQRCIGRVLRAGSLVVAVAGTLFVLSSSVYSLVNWFTDPAFTKADFRGAAGYVREHLELGEAVVLSSGHFYPVWGYYAPDLTASRLPNIDILDINATLGYHSAADLNAALDSKSGVWTVLWQNEVVDPNDFLGDFLTRAGQEQPVDRSFWHVGLRHFRLPPGVQFSSDPPIEHALAASFANLVRLLGWSQDASDVVTLFWQAPQGTARDLKVSLVLEDPSGHEWGRSDRRPAAYAYPTFRWQPGEVLFGRYDLLAVPGTPPGSAYRLKVTVYDETDMAGLDVLDPAGKPHAKSVTLEGVTVSQLASGDALGRLMGMPGAQSLGADFAPALHLHAYTIDPTAMLPGEDRTLSTLWRADSILPDVTVRCRWLGESGEVLGEDVFRPGVQGEPGYPTSQWQPGDIVLAQTTLWLPPDVTADKVTLELTPLVDGHSAGDALALLSLPVVVPQRTWAVPSTRVPVAAVFESLVRLVGLDFDALAAARTTLPVTVTWQALGDLAAWELTGFVHLLAADGQVVAQDDHVPQGGQRPTSGWLPAEVVSDSYELSLPAELPPGSYAIEVGLYLSDGSRLLVTEPAAIAGRDSVVSGVLQVE